MTQHRAQKDRLSNWFDDQLRGIGHDGSSFTDIDALVHDKRTDRFLLMEFKWDGYAIPKGQALALKAIARKPDFTVWGLKRLKDDRVKALEVISGRIDVISVRLLRYWFSSWWQARPVSLAELVRLEPSHDRPVNQPPSSAPLTADDMRWGFSK